MAGHLAYRTEKDFKGADYLNQNPSAIGQERRARVIQTTLSEVRIGRTEIKLSKGDLES